MDNPVTPVKKRVFLCACLCALCVEAGTSATPAQNAWATRFQRVMDTQDACPPSPAQAFLAHLRQIGESGRFVYSWTNPWRPADPAFRVQEEGGWRPKAPDEFAFTSKFKGVTGEDYAPVMYFTELNFVAGTYLGEEAYAKNRASMTAMVRKAWRDYRAVPVFSWHVENPYAPSGWTDPKYGEKPYRYRYASDGYPQEDKCVIREILEGIGGKCGRGRQSSCGEDEAAAAIAYANPRAWYEARLKEIASFLDGLKDADGEPIPAVVRLFHECEDDWAWWGRGSVTVGDYVEIFRYTVERLRELTGGGENLLFAYSPDRYWWEMGTEGDGNAFSFMGRYPGDAYVDLIGYDDYLIGTGSDGQMVEKRFSSAVEKMRQITKEAQRRGKVCGLFESGAIEEARPDYYDWLHKALTAEGVGFSFANLWSGYEIPKTPEGKECFKRFLQRPEVIILRGGIPPADSESE